MTLRTRLRPVRACVHRLQQRIVRHLVPRPMGRRLLHAGYTRLTLEGQATAHRRFAKVFRGSPPDTMADGLWSVDFAGRAVLVPLTAERLWLDWDVALSLLGHDNEVKATYAALLRGDAPPDLFLDVGANYGLHSLLFLVHGVRTVSFEPNDSCHDYFREVCRLNGVQPTIEAVALGEHPGVVDLVFPEGDTWLGTVTAVAARPGERRRPVAMRRLDDYGDLLAGARRPLVKVDTEGSDAAVLRGGAAVLKRHRPPVVFESLTGEGREALHDFLGGVGYGVASLPWSPPMGGEQLGREAFAASRATNFLAIPAPSRAR